ncbi:MAG: arylsulfatase [Planctomycetaceae bacterium]|nr:arylsulfatase [Planctomycetaceae bacterium]
MSNINLRVRSTIPAILLTAFLSALPVGGQERPNVLLIYADDLGYGDVECYNPACKIPTPNLNRLAAEGMRFTDAHSPSTVCTPSRYGVMTGRMPFRTNYQGVFVGVQGPCLIEANRLTLPEMLQQQGYRTALFGKWHLGLTFLDHDGQPVYETNDQRNADLVRHADLSRVIPDGPLAHGFDKFFGTACCPTTDWLYAYIDGDRIPVQPTKIRDLSQLPNHPYARDCRAGLVAPGFDFEEIDILFLEKSKAFLEHHVEHHPGQPFFLFHSAQAVHLPSFAGRNFQGKTSAGPHGDFIFELDHIVGELLNTLERLQIADHTLVIFSSDNGPEVPTTLQMRTDHAHDSARPWRGLKRDQWEGGHRVPFLVRWPGKIHSGSISNETICQTDLMHTCAALSHAELPADTAEDSFNLLPIFLGEEIGEPVRPFTLHQTINLSLAIRRGPWKYLDHRGSGGNHYEHKHLQHLVIPEDVSAAGQLYNLEQDPGETHNLYHKHPEIVRELKELLDATRKSDRSRPIH